MPPADRRFAAEAHEIRLRERTRGSLERFERAERALAGGVSSGLRRFARPHPLYFAQGCGSHVTDVDGNRYIDYGLAWGPLILGHAHPEITAAVRNAADRSLTYGAQHDLEYEMAELVTRLVPCAELVAFSNSGTEIVQIALRLARAVTGRWKHLKFEGHYHGWDDSVLVSYHPTREEIERAGDAPAPVGYGQRPESGAVIAQWNDRASVEAAFEREGANIAALICEPILCNSGCIPPEPGFLEFLRAITQERGAALIFDEVITGFRLALGGAQEFYGVTPDLATFAKALGGGVPLSALGGSRDWMRWIAEGKVIHGGSLNGNPVSLAAGKATLSVLARDNGAVYPELWRRGERLRLGIETALRESGREVVTAGGGPVFQVSFMERPARNYRDTLAANHAVYADFAIGLLDHGVLTLHDGRWYVSAVHSDQDIDRTLAAVRQVAAE